MDAGTPQEALRRALRRLDGLGAPLGARVGLGLGALVGGGAVYLGGASGAALGAAALGGALALVVTARPLALREAPAAEASGAEEPPDEQGEAGEDRPALGATAPATPRPEAAPARPAETAAAVSPAQGAESMTLGAHRVVAPPWPGAAAPLAEPLEMIELPGGSFLMGSEGPLSFPHERPVHRVEVAAFAMGETAVTQRLYREIMGENPGRPQGDDLPVNNVDWLQAVTFCNRLSQRVGLAPCYDIRGRDVTWRPGTNGYRLPTEAEWEYAARAGTQTEYSFGDDEAQLSKYAWFDRNSEYTLHPVAQKKPNPWGLYDMHGNVWEWCWDWFGNYQTEPDKVARVVRGGSFGRYPSDLRAAFRNWVGPGGRSSDLGFRCVRGSVRQR